METKHTCGPWIKDDSKAGGFDILGPDGSWIATVHCSREEDEADANLIAAAPELKESLLWIVTFCREHVEWFGDPESDQGAEFDWLDDAETLLAKLRGES